MQTNDQKIYSLLGLAMRGRNLVSGEQQVMDAIRDGSAFLVLVAKDASDNTRKMFRDKSTFYEVPFAEFGSKEQLGHALGKEYRSSVAVCEEGLAKKVISYLGE